VRRSVDVVQCQCGMPSHRSETVRSGPRGTQAEGPCDCGSVAYSSCMLPLKGLQDRVAVKGSSRELVGGARGFFALAWGVTLSHHFDRVDRCSADQRMSDVRPAWSKVNSATMRGWTECPLDLSSGGNNSSYFSTRDGWGVAAIDTPARGFCVGGGFFIARGILSNGTHGGSGLDPIPRHAIRHPRFRVC